MERIVEIIPNVWVDLEKVIMIYVAYTEHIKSIRVCFSKDEYVTINDVGQLKNITNIWINYHCNKFIHSRNFENND